MYDIHRMHRLFPFASDLSIIILGEDLGEPNAVSNRIVWELGRQLVLYDWGTITQYDVDRYLGI